MKFAESDIGGVAPPSPIHRQNQEVQLPIESLSFFGGKKVSPSFYLEFDSAASLYPMLNRIFTENDEYLRYKNVSTNMANTLTILLARGIVPSPFSSLIELGKFLTNLPLHPEHYHTKITE